MPDASRTKMLHLTLAVLVGAGTALRCGKPQDERPVLFIGTTETREFFGLTNDTLAAVESGLARQAESAAREQLAGFGSRPDSICSRAFDTRTGQWLVYVAGGCKDFRYAPGLQDGDALMLVSTDGSTVLKTLLNPGGIELLTASDLR
jgi:hypothetical protein